MDHANPIALQPTGIPSFDALLNGGIPHGTTLLAAGPSGSGKTMFCVHWLFNGWQQHKEPGLYISLTEPISKLLRHQSQNDFFNKQVVDEGKVEFKDLRVVLEHDRLDIGPLAKEDVNQIVERISNMVLEVGAKRVVLDSVTAMCYRLQSPDLIRHFIFTLGTTLAYLDATVILTSEVTGEGVSIFGVEEFISDGIFKFSYESNGDRTFKVLKLRGHSYNAEPTKFSISTSGLMLFPLPKQELTHQVSMCRSSTGVQGLDDMLGGGLIDGSCVQIKGPSGSGKTILSHHIVQQALQDGKKVLHVSFEQSVQEVLATAKAFSWQREEYQASGQLKVSCLIPDSHYVSAHIHYLEVAITQFGYNLVVMDSLLALAKQFPTTELFTALKRFITFCKNSGVTLVVTNSARSILDASEATDVVINISGLVDTSIFLRFIEIDSTLRHGVLVVKMRQSEHIKRMMELSFTTHGAIVTDGFSGYDQVMSGNATKVSSSEEDKIYSLFLETFGAEGENLFAEQKAIGLQYDHIQSFTTGLVPAGIMNEEEYTRFMQRVKEIV